VRPQAAPLGVIQVEWRPRGGLVAAQRAPGLVAASWTRVPLQGLRKIIAHIRSQRVLGARLGVSEMQECTGHMILLVREKFVAAMSWFVLFRSVQCMYRGTSLIRNLMSEVRERPLRRSTIGHWT
jgi:hypothetical protein